MAMAEGAFQHIISGWGLMQACSSKQPSDLGGHQPDFTPDLDDAEDFHLSKAENSDRFGQPISDEALDEAIVKRVPYKTRKATERVSIGPTRGSPPSFRDGSPPSG